MSISKRENSTTKSILDSVRILVIWGISLACGWQMFQVLHLVGYILYTIGICIYLEIIVFPCARKDSYDLNSLGARGCCKMDCGDCCSSVTCLWCPINVSDTDANRLAVQLTGFLTSNQNLLALPVKEPAALQLSQPKSKTLSLEPRNIPV